MEKIKNILLAIFTTKLFIGAIGIFSFFYTGKFFCMTFFPEQYVLFQVDIYSYHVFLFLYGLCFWFVVLCLYCILFFSYEEALGNYKKRMSKESE